MAPPPRHDTPPVLTVPPKPSATPGPTRSVKPVVIGALAALLALIIGVVWFLPRWVAEHPPEISDAAPGESTPAPVAPADAIQRAQDKRAAEAMLGGVLRRQSQLAEASVDRWAAKEYAAALKRLAEGDVAFEATRYRDALAAYTAVAKQFEALQASRPRRLAEALQAGAAALQRLDAPAAARDYQIALALDPGNAVAAHGLERAGHLDDVIAKVKQGETAAKAGHWRAARDAFKAAVAVDPEYAPASSGLKQAEAMLIELRFKQRISAFYQALSANQLAKAKAQFDQARKLRPGAKAVETARQRLVSAAQQAALESWRAQAEHQVKAERWHDAVDSFSQALKIDPNVAFAQQGLALARRRAQLDDALQGYLDRPERLFSPEPLARARKVLELADAIDANIGPRLLKQRRRLRTLIRQAGTPLPVTISSDGQTEVAINRMAPLGRFLDRRLNLLPGDYVVVGSRPGYRDVRISFRVAPGTSLKPIVVICEDRL